MDRSVKRAETVVKKKRLQFRVSVWMWRKKPNWTPSFVFVLSKNQTQFGFGFGFTAAVGLIG